MASPAEGSEFVRPSPSGRTHQRQVLVAVLLVVVAASTVGGSHSRTLTIVAATTVVIAGWVVWAAWTRTRLELHPDRLVVRHAFSAVDIAWTEVAAVHLEWWSSRNGVGYTFGITRMPGADEVPVSLPPLASGAVAVVKQHVRTHFIPVLVNPTEPWVDRAERWYGEGHQYDPFESIRSIRSAAVGPWLVRVRATEGGFHAITSNTADGAVFIEGPVRSRRAEATIDAEQQIRQCASDLMRRRM